MLLNEWGSWEVVALQVGLFQLEGFARKSEGHFVKQMYVIKFMSLLAQGKSLMSASTFDGRWSGFS